MGLKGDSDHKGRPAIPTGEQLRLAKLTDGNHNTEEDPDYIKRLIKKVIETTLCTKSQAEIALFDNDNDVDAAVIQILENPELTWTETGKKKEKKKEEEFRPARGQSAQRGRGQWSDRPSGRGRGAFPNGSSRGTSRGAAQSGRGGYGGGASSQSRPPAVRPQAEFTKVASAEPDLTEDNKDWKSGPLVFKRSEEVASSNQSSSNIVSSSSTNAPSVSVSSNAPSAGPISFAAVAAAGANKEKQRQQQLSAPVQSFHDEPTASVSVEETIPEPEVYHEEEPEPSAPSPIPEPVEEDDSQLAASPVLQANDSWTSQLKSDLGIGSSPQPAVQFAGSANVSSSLPPQTVEFVSEAAPSAPAVLPEYQFGFQVEPAVTIVPTAATQTSVVGTTDVLFGRTPVANNQQPAPVHQKPVEPEPTRHVPNGDYSVLKSSPPSMQSYGQQSRGGLSYDTSSVSYAPPQDNRQSAPKPPPPVSQQQHSQQQQNTSALPSQQQHSQQQQMQYPTATPMPYGNYPYMNMYSPVTGVRADDPSYAAAALMQYPFGMGQIDLSTILPQGSLSGGPSQPSGQPQHRNDTHGLMDVNKYQTGVNSSRDSSVAPPPGFANPNPFVPQGNLGNLFLQQPYAPHPFSFMMPSVGGGRQMYGGGGSGEDDRNKGGYDNKMGKAGGAQATPPPHYPHNYNLGGLGKPPKPNQQQAYGHGGWNN